MHDLLVYTHCFAPWTAGVDYAVQLAARLDAALTGAYVYPSPLYTSPPYSSPELIEAIFENARALETAAQNARTPFADHARAGGVKRVAWHVAEGYLPEALAHIGTWHAALVFERNPNSPWGSPPDIASVVLAVGLPCFVVPPDAKRVASLDTIAIAWNGSPEAVRAVHAALPLLERAQRVVLLAGERRNAYLDVAWKPPIEIAPYLERHGVKAELRELPADDERIGEAILAATAREGADLLVMGAYGRSRFSEWALGGATRHVLAHADLPVFMRH